MCICVRVCGCLYLNVLVHGLYVHMLVLEWFASVYVHEVNVFLHVNKLNLQGVWSRTLSLNPSSAIY